MFTVREFNEKDGTKLAEIFSSAFSDEVSREMRQITAEQFVDLSKGLEKKSSSLKPPVLELLPFQG